MPEPNADASVQPTIWSKSFLAMCLAAFLTFCNMAIFYSFASYLRTLPIDPAWHGALVGVFALVPLLLRPLVSPFFTPANAVRAMAWLAPAVAASLLGYNLAHGLVSMFLVRVLHGLLYVLLMSANLAGIVGCIPPARSGQAFGYVSVIVLLPYAAIPPLLSWVDRIMGGYLAGLNMAALLMLLIPPVVLLLRDGGGQGQAVPTQRPSLAGDQGQPARPPHRLPMTLALLVYTSFAALFFFRPRLRPRSGPRQPGLVLHLLHAHRDHWCAWWPAASSTAATGACGWAAPWPDVGLLPGPCT